RLQAGLLRRPRPHNRGVRDSGSTQPGCANQRHGPPGTLFVYRPGDGQTRPPADCRVDQRGESRAGQDLAAGTRRMFRPLVRITADRANERTPLFARSRARPRAARRAVARARPRPARPADPRRLCRRGGRIASMYRRWARRPGYRSNSAVRGHNPSRHPGVGMNGLWLIPALICYLAATAGFMLGRTPANVRRSRQATIALALGAALQTAALATSGVRA